jgi:CheY-like chemotaxis protein
MIERPLPTVLLVDDEHVILVTLAAILKGSGFSVYTATSGEEAVSLAYIVRPDCLVSDVVMGAVSGIQAAMEIREISPNTQVLLISGNALTTDLLEDARTRGHHFEILAKPFDPVELIARISALVSDDGAQKIAS